MRPKAIAARSPVTLSFSAGPNAALLTLPDVTLFITDADYELVLAAEAHEVLGTDGSAVTADIVHAGDGTALGSGTSLLSSPFNLKAAINTVQWKRLSSGILAARTIPAGRRVGINFTGVMTAVAGVNITVTLNPLSRPNW